MIHKLTWQHRAIQTDEFHKERLRANPKVTIANTAFILRRSKGSVAEDIMLVSWFKTHPDIMDFATQKEALEFIRVKRFEMRIR